MRPKAAPHSQVATMSPNAFCIASRPIAVLAFVLFCREPLIDYRAVEKVAMKEK